MSTNGLKAVLQDFIVTTRDSFLHLSQAQEQTDRDIKRLEQQAERDREAWNQRMAVHEVESQEWKRQHEEWKQQHEAEQKKEKKAWNKQWGELANSLGRVVEDIVAPNISRIAQDYFNFTEPPKDFSIRRKAYYLSMPDKQREFDTVAAYPHAVILNETKETVRQSYLEDFVAFLESGEFYGYFPEYQGRKLIPIFSSLYMSDPAVNYLTKHGIYALAMGDETMELLNFEQLKSK